MIGIINSFSKKDRRPYSENDHIKMNTLDIFELQVITITFLEHPISSNILQAIDL